MEILCQSEHKVSSHASKRENNRWLSKELYDVGLVCFYHSLFHLSEGTSIKEQMEYVHLHSCQDVATKIMTFLDFFMKKDSSFLTSVSITFFNSSIVL